MICLKIKLNGISKFSFHVKHQREQVVDDQEV